MEAIRLEDSRKAWRLALREADPWEVDTWEVDTWEVDTWDIDPGALWT